jgi:hypothetical protein
MTYKELQAALKPYKQPCDSEKEAKRLRTKWINELMRAGKGL